RDAAEVVLAAGGDLRAGARRVGEIAALAGVRRGDEEEAAGVADMGIGAGDDDLAGLDRLAQGFEHGAGELGEFVEEEDAVVGEADLARFRAPPAADDGRHRRGMVRLAKGPRAADPALVEKARER